MSFSRVRLASIADRVSPLTAASEYKIGLESVEERSGRLVEKPWLVSEGDGIAFTRGNILYGKLRPYLSKVWVANTNGSYIGDFVQICPRPALVDPYFLSYVMRSGEFVRQSVSLSTGSKMPRTEWDDLRTIRVPVPSIQDQTRIVNYLDRETTEIDAFIADQQYLLEILEERSRSELMRVVADAKDGAANQVPWAPSLRTAHPVVNIRRVAQMKTGHTPSRAHSEYWEDVKIPWFTLADVWQLRQGNKYLGETSEKISRIGLENSAAELLPPGTVVLSRTASVGFSGIMPIAMATSQDYWNWVCGEKLLPEYLWFQFRVMHSEFDRIKSGSTHKTIYQADAAAIALVLPDLDRQAAIVDELRQADETFQSIKEDALAAIDLAKERRSALISAAVTGQLDVTNL